MKLNELFDDFTEDAAGVGIITKQNTTVDVKPGQTEKEMAKFKLEEDEKSLPDKFWVNPRTEELHDVGTFTHTEYVCENPGVFDINIDDEYLDCGSYSQRTIDMTAAKGWVRVENDKFDRGHGIRAAGHTWSIIARALRYIANYFSISITEVMMDETGTSRYAKLDGERLQMFMKNGAIPSETVQERVK